MRFLHVPLQEVWPGGQGTGVPETVMVLVLVPCPSDELNCPFTQVSPKGTEKPHPPQLLLSALVLTHAPLHSVSPSEHLLLTGCWPELWCASVLFGVSFCWPAGTGEPENAKNAAAPIMTMTITPTSTSNLPGGNEIPASCLCDNLI